jgi:maltose alpha-D-glucosyltransferase/alpha-amylase
MDAIIYELHVRAFFDGTNDGRGDFAGLIAKLDYLQELGVTALWLLPFYPSPQRDGGYDIADFHNIDPTFGDLRLFRRLVAEAHSRGLRVITELVLNHTSDQHPWFQRARRAPTGSRHRDFYVWSDTPDKYAGTRIIFIDTEKSNWTWDPVANAYFWHRFYSHQPDLNYDSPEVEAEMFKVIDHWMDIGVDGVRLDAVPYLYEREGTNNENLPETHEFIKRLRTHVDSKYNDRLLLAEANQWPEDAAAYFGDGDECHMNFHFPLMPRLFMAVRQENRLPIIDILDQTPQLPAGCQWATFLRNHDELTLEMVTDEERDYMYRSYAADPQMRLNLGIRRRLAPLLGNDRRKIELLNAMLFGLPGTPVMYYGDELGMGDNVYLGDRDGVRTPMQWSPDRNAGFSGTASQQLYLPIISDGAYSYQNVNVEHQRGNPNSLLSWTRQMISVRCRHRVLSRGDISFLDPDNHHVLAFVRQLEGEHPFLVVANLSARAQSVELDLRPWAGSIPTEVFGQIPFPITSERPYNMTLSPYGFFWLELRPSDSTDPAAHWTPRELTAGWPAALEGRNPPIIDQLRGWIRRRRWYAGKTRNVAAARIVSAMPVPGVASSNHPMRICTVRFDYHDGDPDNYQVPLTVVSAARATELTDVRPESIVATLPDGRAVIDALADESSVLALARALAVRRARAGALETETTPEMRTALRGVSEDDVRIVALEQSNTTIFIGDKALVKVIRRLVGGESPDLEISRHLSSVDFPASPALLGSMSFRGTASIEADTMAIAYRFIPNEGDAWSHFLDLVGFFLNHWMGSESRETTPPLPHGVPTRDAAHEAHPDLLIAGPDLVQLGRRTAELHLALADSDADAFGPERFNGFSQRSLYQGLRTQVRSTLTMLRRHVSSMHPNTRERADAVLANQNALLSSFESLKTVKLDAVRTRTHGDLHLGQVLYTGRDFVIIDFEGEPARPVTERRIKQSPLRDVAGMIRSFDYLARTALEIRRERGLMSEVDAPLNEAWASWWTTAATNAFLSGYMETEGIERVLPRDQDTTERLLDAFVLEKALYELRYELDNRPAWVWLPLSVLAEKVRR